MSTGIVGLVTWVITAGFGLTLFLTWLAGGGLTHGRWLKVNLPPPYFPAPLVFSHIFLASGGLVFWIAYLLTHSRATAWIALFMLLPVAVFGFSMFGRWLGSRRLRFNALPLLLPPRRFSAIRDVRPVPPVRTRPLAESRLPAIIVVCHGLFGATTIVLVLATVVGTSGG